MLIANISHTPLPELFGMTWRQIAVFAAALPEVVKTTSPWPSEERDKPISDPKGIRAIGASMGLLKHAPDS